MAPLNCKLAIDLQFIARNGHKHFSLLCHIFQYVGTFIGVGVGVAMFLLIVLLTSVVVLILVVTVVRRRRKAVYKQNSNATTGNSLCYNNSVVVEQETKMKENSVVADCQDADGYQEVDIAKGREENPFDNNSTLYEAPDKKLHVRDKMTPAPKESSTPGSATTVPVVYAAVDKSNKKASKKAKNESTVTNEDAQYAMPMKKKGKMAGIEMRVVASGCVDEEQYDDTAQLRYEPKADSS